MPSQDVPAHGEDAAILRRLMAPQSCGVCRYFFNPVPPEVAERQVKALGFVARKTQCRRYPVLTPKSADDWCGEFAAT